MRPFVTAEEMSEVDSKTIQKLRINSFQLMEKVVEELFHYFQKNLKGPYLFLCGPGNNGGDGYLLAEKLRKAGEQVSILVVAKPESKDCVRASKICKARRVKGSWPKVITIVDAIFGYNGRAELSSSVKEVLQRANSMRAKKIALDIPTGIESSKKKFNKHAFEADVTLSIGFPKVSFIHEDVAEFLGKVETIGDFFSVTSGSKYFQLEPSDFKFRKQKKVGHKSLYGRCGVIGGSKETPGAAFLAAEAAHRVGAGYVTLFLARGRNEEINMKSASFLFKPDWKIKDLDKPTSLVIGCGGLPKNFEKEFKKLTQPCVFDADAFVSVKIFKNLKTNSILTPHPGEAARLLKKETTEIKADRLSALDELVQKTNQAVYLKGVPGLLKFPDSKKYYVNLSINPIFSKAGSGDILAGILGGFLAQNPKDFRGSVFSALVFQNAIGEVLRDYRATIAADQLRVFSLAFSRL